jgi:predicted transcriptional regulator
MTAIELKNILIHRITEIEDVSFLKAINTILDSKTNNEILTLSNAQRDEIIASKKEIEQGLFIEHDSLDKEIKGWLKEK